MVTDKSSNSFAPKPAPRRRPPARSAPAESATPALGERQGATTVHGLQESAVNESHVTKARSPPQKERPTPDQGRNEAAGDTALLSVQSVESLLNEVNSLGAAQPRRTDLEKASSPAVVTSRNEFRSTPNQEALPVAALGVPSTSMTRDSDAERTAPTQSANKRRRIERGRDERPPTAKPATKRRKLEQDRKGRTTATSGTNRGPGAATKSSIKTKGKRGRPAKAKSKDEAASKSTQTEADPEEATPISTRRKGKARQSAPDNIEVAELAPSIVTMAELCKGSRKGQTSKREQDLAKLDKKAVTRRQKKQQAQQQQQEEAPPLEMVDQMPERVGVERELPPQARAAPKLRLVNGKMVVDDQSLQVDRHAHAAAEVETMEEIEENELTRRITSGSWMKREKKVPWNEELTDRFYQGLRMFGTDFMIISKMFPGRTRRQIKLKFTKEERLDPQRIRDSLVGPKEPMDLDLISQYTNVEYGDPAEFLQELEKEAREHAEEINRQEEQAQDALRQKRVDNAATAAAAAISGADDRVGLNTATEENSSAKENEVQAKTAGKATKSGRGKGPKAAANKRKKKMHSRHGGGEEVEILGTIEDVQRARAGTDLAG